MCVIINWDLLHINQQMNLLIFIELFDNNLKNLLFQLFCKIDPVFVFKLATLPCNRASEFLFLTFA